MNKKTKYARNGALLLGFGNAGINVIKQLNKIEDGTNLKFDWGELLRATVKGAVTGGTGGFALGAISDYQNSLEKPIDIDAFLFSVVDSVRLNKHDRNYISLDEKADRLLHLLHKMLGNKIAGKPIRLGSTEHGTALADNFDIDICLPFRPDSFTSTAQMYSHLYDCLKPLVGKQFIVEARGQKKSIGVLLELRGEKRRIDIVPYKLTSLKSNKTSGYLFVNDPINPSYTKTDIHALNGMKLTETQKRIVIVLKYWKTKCEIPLSSHLLQNFVIDAYQRNKIPKGFTHKVIMVLKHIRDKMDVAVIRSVENTNNVLTNISDRKKVHIIEACGKLIEEYEYQPNSLVDHFKIELN